MDPSDPASFEHKYALLSTGRRYHYVDQKPEHYDPAANPTLLCVHGFPDCWYGWRFQIRPWVRQGYRVVVPDMLGYGGTDKPAEPEEYSPKRLSDDLAALLNVVGVGKAVVVGHDWGAFVSGRFALWHPERLLALVILSVPFTPPSTYYVPLERIVEHAPNLGYQLYFADDKFTKEIESNLRTMLPLMYRGPNGGVNFTKPGALRPILRGEKVVEDLKAKCILDDKELEYYLEQLRHMHGPLSYYRTSKIRFEEEKAANLPSSPPADVPVLFMWGTKDPTSRALLTQKARNPRIHEVALEGKGHWVMVEARQPVTDDSPNMSYSQPFPLAATHAPPQPAQPAFGPDLAVRLICPECKDPNPNIIEEFASGDLVCGTCGLVLGDRIVDTRSEWRTFANDEGDDPSRVGAASDPLMEGMEQLDTMISFRDGGSGIAKELQRAASRSQHSRSERNLVTAFRDIASWCDQFSLPKTISDIAKQLYKRTDEEKLLRGKPLDAVIAACIFIACRRAHVPRTFREICNLTKVSKKVLGQCYKALEQAFNLTPGASANKHGQAGPGTTTTNPEDLLIRYCNHLALPPNVQGICKDIIQVARDRGIAVGRSPVSIAGGAIYFAVHLLGLQKPIKDIVGVAGVSESTIKLVYRLYYNDREQLVKKEWIEEGKADLNRLPAD
ncbi:alpha/beta-hydrolase [Gloeophyllum trabeum ATCC 11539]|uniref:Transcription initiation factor IIB n=1 Tax=Gloeophyllum trabeum (strain ATCC 11539 / FP-39264 / Madison 617) TaxID=670483 RepID=S7QH94_GLOTA|nr:alpha/beta-hydrolase [Gloeophyllum trabeum ATCC 11539]EPQ59176.1 alpha/beta-hydrolase [Gloeophyllum trabeum ATCC 11539]